MKIFSVIWLEIAWVMEIALFLLLALGANLAFKKILHKVKNASIGQAVLAPLQTLTWVFFAFFSMDLIERQFDYPMGDLRPMRNACIVLCATWFLFRWKTLVEKTIELRRHTGKHAPDVRSAELFGKIFSIGVLVLTGLVLLQNFGLNIAPLLAFGGIGAATLGFASKDAISNLYGGALIYLTQPFSLRDVIELPHKQLRGTVEKIGWYFTTLRDLSKKPLYVPNALFITELVINESRMTHRFLDETISIGFEDAEKIPPFIEQIRNSLAANPSIDQAEPIHVFARSLRDSTLDLEVRAYTKATQYLDFMEIKQNALLQICSIARRMDLSLGSNYLLFAAQQRIEEKWRQQ